MEWFCTYEDALEKVSDYLISLPNVSEFCRLHSLCYQNVMNIKKKDKKSVYTNLVMQILIIMGYQVEKKVCFVFKDVTLKPNNE